MDSIAFPEQPYQWDHISEAAKRRQMQIVVHDANPITKVYYKAGEYNSNAGEENWVFRWYLWHSFRFRDNKREGRVKVDVPMLRA